MNCSLAALIFLFWFSIISSSLDFDSTLSKLLHPLSLPEYPSLSIPKDGDYYYVRGFCDERQAMRTFRLDRIKAQPVILHEIAVTPPEGYNPEEYHKAVFRMYDTDEPKEVTLFCHVSAMKYLIDNFGQRFWSEPVDEEHFRAKVRVCTSTTFYRWVFGFTGRIRIEGPEETVEEYREQIRSAAKENGVL